MRRALVPLLAALAITAPLAVPAVAAPGTPTQGDTVGGDADGFPLLDHPTSVQASNAGDLAIATTAGGVRLATSGQQLFSPTPVANTAAYYIDGATASYTTVTGNSHLWVMSPSGAVTVTLDPGSTETSLALDKGSPYYGPALYGLHDGDYVDVLSPTSTATGLGEAIIGGFPVRASLQIVVAADHSLYLLADTGNKLWHYSEQGIYLGPVALNVPGESAGTVGAKGVGLDGQGTLYVADFTNRRVAEFTLGGTYLGMFGDQDLNVGTGTPASPGQLDGPTSVSIDCHGRLWLLDVDMSINKGRVLRYDGVASPLGSCAAEPVVKTVKDAQAGILATDRAGNVWSSAYGAVDKLDVNGALVTHWGSVTAQPDHAGSFGTVGGIAVRPNGNLLVGSYRFLTVSPDGQTTTTTYNTTAKIIEWRSAGALVKEWTDPLITAPQAIAVRPSDGEIFVANGSNKGGTVLPHLEEYNASFVHQRTITLPDLGGFGPTLISSTMLSFDNAGDLLVAVRQRQSSGGSAYFGYFTYFSQVVKVVPGTDTPIPLFVAPTTLWGGNTVDSVLQAPDGTYVVGSRETTGSQITSAALIGFSSSGSPMRHWYDGAIAAGSTTKALLDCRGRLVFLTGSFTSLGEAPWASGKSCTWRATAITGPMVSRTTAALKVRGYSNPASQVTKLRILYGATAAHGKATAWITLPSDNVQLTKDVTITGLLTKHTYHYAVQVMNAAGTVTGADKTATTL